MDFGTWFFDIWGKRKENQPTRAYVENSGSEVKSLYEIMKEAWDAALKNNVDKAKNM